MKVLEEIFPLLVVIFLMLMNMAVDYFPLTEIDVPRGLAIFIARWNIMTMVCIFVATNYLKNYLKK